MLEMVQEENVQLKSKLKEYERYIDYMNQNKQ